MSPTLARRHVLSLLASIAGLGTLAQACAGDDEPDRKRDGGPWPDDERDVDAATLNDAATQDKDAGERACAPTSRDVEGPYYEPGAPSRTMIASASEPGERIVIRGVVYGPDCKTPLPNALVDVWQADEKGSYHGSEEEYRLRGQMRTSTDGSYEFETVMPGRYAQGGGFRPAHIHFKVSAAERKALTTQLYFAGDPYLPPNDACGSGCNSGAVDLVTALEGAGMRRGVFDVVLE